MDLNQLYFDHQVLRIRADGAVSSSVSRRHERGASLIAARIGSMQRKLGATAARSWEILAATERLSLAAPSLSDAGLLK